MDRLTRRKPLLFLLLLLLLSWIGCGREDRPNLVVVVIDSLRADHLGYAGYERKTSPFLDRLAAEGLVFTRAYSTSSWTKPAVASLLTGLYPESHGVESEVGPRSRLAASLQTLPELLAGEGYATFGYVANPLISGPFGFDQGFDEFQVYADWIDQSTGPTTEAVAARLDRLENREPFFLFIHYLDPHGAYQPPIRYDEFFRSLSFPRDRKVWGGQDLALSGELEIDASLRPTPLPVPAALGENDLAYLVALYDAEIRAVDSALRDLLGRMEKRGLLENTLVVLTADHGEEFLDHGLLRHGFQLYEETVRVPLLFWGERVVGDRAGERDDRIVEIVDLFPTLLEQGRVDVPGGAPGRSLLSGTEEGWKGRAFGSTRYRGLDKSYLVEDGHKLIVDEANESIALYLAREELGEERDLSPEKPLIAAALEAKLRTFRDGLAPPPEASLDSTAIDPETRRRLRALGYMR